MSLLSASSLSAIPQLGVVLGIMVLVHEFGHFAAAKLCGVRVEAFAIGFGRKLFGFESGGTSYQINLLPLGGYVKMAGELPGEERHSEDPGEFQNHPRWQRTVITLAGPVANFLLSIGLLTALFMHHHEVPEYLVQTPALVDYVGKDSIAAHTGIQAGDTIVHFDTLNNPSWGELEQQAHFNLNHPAPFAFVHDGHRVDTQLFVENKGREEEFGWDKLGFIPAMQTTPVEVASLSGTDSPAARAGLQPRDLIVKVDALKPHSVESILRYLQDEPGKTITLAIDRPEASGTPQHLLLPVTPVQMDTAEGKGWRIGFGRVIPEGKVERLGFGAAVKAAWDANVKGSLLIFEVLHRLFTRQVSIKAMSSPIGIGVMVHQAFQARDWKIEIIQTMAMISLNLGIFNLLPIPILDGGSIVFLAIESVIRRDLNPRFKERIYQVAFVCILLFAAVVIFNDITKFLPVHAKG